MELQAVEELPSGNSDKRSVGEKKAERPRSLAAGAVRQIIDRFL